MYALLLAAFSCEPFNTGNVAHFGFTFDGFDILPRFLLKGFGQAHHSVEHSEQVKNALPVPSLAVEQGYEGTLCLVARVRVAPGLSCA